MKTIALTLLESQAPACPLPESAALDVAAERLELLRAEIEAQARHHWQHGQDAEGMADWLKASALKFAVRTLQARLDASAVSLFQPKTFEYARRILWEAAKEWAEVAGIALSIPDPETHGSAQTNAAALRYAAQLLAGETPADALALAA